MQKYILFALIAMLIYSVTPILYKQIPKTNAVSLIFVFSLAGFLFSGILLLKPGTAQLNWNNFSMAFVIGILINIAFIAYISAVRMGDVSVATVLRHLSVVITFILAIVLLAEKITWLKIIGGIFGVVAIILLSL